MYLATRLRLNAIFCSCALLLCALISRPFANIAVCDDGSYILSAQTLAATGHIVYNGGATAMLGWQLYLGAAFIKLFGSSLTAPRMSTLLIAMLIAFLLQRTFVRLDITERNATLATLAFVLSPLFLILSVTFMSDVYGLFALVLCLYGCVRALQASSPRAAIAWLLFAIITNTVTGTARQISWLGILVMVPSTLWLLRSHRRLLLAGAATLAAGLLFMLGCIRWFAHQPFSIPEHLRPEHLNILHGLVELFHTALDVPFLLLPITFVFLLRVWRLKPLFIVLIAASVLAYLALASRADPLHSLFPLEPTQGDWITIYGGIMGVPIHGPAAIFLSPAAQNLLTIVSLGGLLCLFVFIFESRSKPPALHPSPHLPTHQLRILLGPFTIANVLLLVPRATNSLFDRYLLILLVVALIFALRFYQNRIQPRLPTLTGLVVALTAVFAVAITHNTFSLNRARVAMVEQLRRSGVPDTSVDNGWDYNFLAELEFSDHINDSRIVVPKTAYIPAPIPPAGPCTMWWFDKTPHIHPLYAVSLDPAGCGGPAPFAPIRYSRWLASPGTLYVVNMTRPPNP